MNFVGSKNKISKYLKPIIESYITDKTKYYIEPFVGGANMIDKINFENKIGSDIHKELIALLNWMKDDVSSIPDTFSEEEYLEVKFNRDKYDDKYIGLIGFCGAYGASFMTGFAKSNDNKGNKRDMPSERIRNIKKQSANIQNIRFEHCNYLDYDPCLLKNSVIYCDPPYRGTFGYNNNGKNDFNHDEFYDWCKKMSKNNIVLISEYNMPSEDFECIWEKKVKVNVKNSTKNGRLDKIERLFIVK